MKQSYSKSSLLFVNVNIEQNRGDWEGVGHKPDFDLYETKSLLGFQLVCPKPICIWFETIPKGFQASLLQPFKIHKNMTHSSQVREEWTTELGGVDQEVSG